MADLKCPKCELDTWWKGSEQNPEGCYNPACEDSMDKRSFSEPRWATGALMAVEGRLSQGLPPNIEDMAVLSRIAAIMRSVNPVRVDRPK